MPIKTTPSFQQWFGNSKVVDASGAPLVVYHGTGADFSVFDAKRAGQNFDAASLGFYFTSAAEPAPLQGVGYGSTASEYARNAGDQASVMPVYLTIKNPLIIDNAGEWGGAAMAIDRQKNDLARWAKSGGHDGVIAYDGTGEDPERIYVAFDATQIKSAVGNIGTFDAANSDIRFSQFDQDEEAEVIASDSPCKKPTPAFQKWFGDSKVVDADGAPLVVYHLTFPGRTLQTALALAFTSAGTKKRWSPTRRAMAALSCRSTSTSIGHKPRTR